MTIKGKKKKHRLSKEKLDYRAPKLTLFGEVKDLTAGGSIRTNEMAPPSMSRQHNVMV